MKEQNGLPTHQASLLLLISLSGLFGGELYPRLFALRLLFSFNLLPVIQATHFRSGNVRAKRKRKHTRDEINIESANIFQLS